MVDQFINIFFDPHRKVDLLVGHQGFDMIGLPQIGGIVNQDFNSRLVPPQRNPDIIEQKRFFELVDQFEGNLHLRIKTSEGTSEIR